MIETSYGSSFPDQVVPDEVKASYDYGLKVGQAIEGEWFGGTRAGIAGFRFASNYNNFHQLRLYARGEQSVQKYKDELSINGDLSYLNLDWTPVPILSKFVDIVVNGMSQRNYDIKAYAQDPTSSNKRSRYVQGLMKDIYAKEYIAKAKAQLGIDVSSSGGDASKPQNPDEISVYMQLNYKQNIEVAQEEAINYTLDFNKYDLTRRRLNYDLTVLGIACSKTSFNLQEGITVDYVDPANLVYSYTEDPNFEDIWYVGEVKGVSMSELKKQFPHLTPSELEEIEKYPGNSNYRNDWNGRYFDDKIQLLYFEYKTFTNQVFKIKETPHGLEKALEKTDAFNPPEEINFKKAFRSIEVLYSGVKILGYPQVLKWQMAENMTRPQADTTKVNMNYNICAPRMYKGRIDSLVKRVTGFADMIQLTHLKLQQVLSRMVPDGVYLDVDGLAEVDLGNGTNYNPQEALNMYFQTGSIVGRSMTQDGDQNLGKVPIQELQTGSGNQKIASLIQAYNYYLQMIRDVTGLNEARDGSDPDKHSLVGLQKIAAANSNTATRHILQSSLYLTLRNCENISLRINDALMYPLTRSALQQSISKFNVSTLEELIDTNIHDFGIFLSLEPDDEEKAKLEENIQIALKQGGIDLEDAIDIREVKNLTLANQLLKQRRKQKQQREEAFKMQQIQAQAQAQAETAEKVALAETQKQQILTEQKVQLEQAKTQMDIEKYQQEAQVKMMLMEKQFGFDLQLEKAKESVIEARVNNTENRKDERVRIEGTQRSQLIDQQQNDLLPTSFERNPAEEATKEVEENPSMAVDIDPLSPI
jgi:hypothetical protein